MYHVRCCSADPFGETLEDRVFRKSRRILAEVSFDKVLEEIFLLPTIQGLIEDRLQIKVFGWASVEKLVELFESGAVVGFTLLEWSIFKAEEILIA